MISIQQYRISIGSWNLVLQSKSAASSILFPFNKRFLNSDRYMSLSCTVIIILSTCNSKYKLTAIIFILLIMSGTIHPNPGPTKLDLSVCHINCRSLYAFDKELKSHTVKLEEIEFVLCQVENFEVICMSETWLSSKISDADINIPDYSIYRHDRDNQDGYGGVCIYISDRVKSSHKPNMKSVA